MVRRELGLKAVNTRPIALLTTQITGGKARLMEFARLAIHIEPALAPVVESYEGLTHWKRAAVSIDELCFYHGIDPIHFIGVVGEAAYKYANNSAILIAALQFPDVITKSVKEALKPNGFKDREVLMKHHGFIPTPHGTSINVQANAAARADASAAPESKGLPSFEQCMRIADDIIRGRD
jgi:hypothetical protein